MNWRPTGRSLLGAALVVAFAFAFTSQAGAQTAGGAELYRLAAKHSGKCLDVFWATTAQDGDVVQSRCVGTPNQTWAIYWYQNIHNMVLVAQNSGMCLDVKDRSLAHAADVVQHSCDWGDSQIWQRQQIKIVNGIPYYILLNKRSGKCLDVAWFSQADGGNVLQANCTATDNQLWDLYNLTYGYHGW